jgi:hypothetical protein
MTGMTYPSGRDLTYNYGTGSAINDACSRIEPVISSRNKVTEIIDVIDTTGLAWGSSQDDVAGNMI